MLRTEKADHSIEYDMYFNKNVSDERGQLVGENGCRNAKCGRNFVPRVFVSHSRGKKLALTCANVYAP